MSFLGVGGALWIALAAGALMALIEQWVKRIR